MIGSMTLISMYFKTEKEGMKKIKSKMSISIIIEIMISFAFIGRKSSIAVINMESYDIRIPMMMMNSIVKWKRFIISSGMDFEFLITISEVIGFDK